MAKRDFGILLGLAYQGFVDQLHAELARQGFVELGPAYGYVIRAIDAEPGIRQRDLARRLAITEQGTGKIIDAMVRDRLVRRRPDPGDRRAHRLELGTRGLALLTAARRFHARFERDLARDLGRSVATTRRILEAIVARSGDDTADGRLRAT
jgi:MarR family transcriptional regulator for hemolysin